MDGISLTPKGYRALLDDCRMVRDEALDALEQAADALALASHLARDKGTSLSCEAARRSLKELRKRT